MRKARIVNGKKCFRRFLPKIIFLLTSLSIIGVLTGCHNPQIQPGIAGHDQLEQGFFKVFTHTAGYSIEKRPIECIELGNGNDTIFILATIHGDEFAGTPLVRKLSDYLQSHRELLVGKKVAIVPVANPDGLFHNIRTNVRKVDLNRNFATSNRENCPQNGLSPLTEPESIVLKKLIDYYKPNRIISLHQPFACIDYDGPAAEIANALSAYCQLPVKKLGALPGSLGSYVGNELKIPIITVELRETDGDLTSEQLWDKYGNMLLASIVWPQKPEQYLAK